MAGLEHAWKRMGACRVLWGNLMERDHLETLAEGGRILAIILKEIR
jgi:hypothetical protein